MTFTPEVLTCCTLYSHCDYYLTLLIIYERLNLLRNNLTLMAMYPYNPHLAQPEEDCPLIRAWFLSRYLPRFLSFYRVVIASVLLYLHCLLFGVFGWVSE